MLTKFALPEFHATEENLLGEREIYGPQFSDLQKLDSLNFGGDHMLTCQVPKLRRNKTLFAAQTCLASKPNSSRGKR